MLKLLTALLLSVFFFANTPGTVSADFNQAYQDYVFKQQQYKNAYNQFQISKSSFLTYKTLTSQNDALAKFKEVLKSRNQLLSAYYDLLQEKLNSTEGVSNDTKSTFNGIKESEKTWLAQNQTEIDSAGSLKDLNAVSNEFKTKYPQMSLETKQAIGNILLSKEETLRGKLDTKINDFNSKLSLIRSDGENIASVERGLITIQDKLNFQSSKVESARKTFSGTDKNSYNREINLLEGQKSLIEANQYLKEAATNLLELVRSFTG